MPINRYNLLITLFMALISLFAEKAFSGDYTEGKIIFKSKCQACHQIEGDGSISSAYHRQYRPKDFSKSISWEGLSEEKINFVLTRGKGVMRPIPLTAEESKALIDYMINDLKK